MKKTKALRAKNAKPASLAPRIRTLSLRQQRFVENFLGPCRGNAERAALAAGYSRSTARKQASRCLRLPTIRAAIDERVKADPLALDREALQQFWSRVVRGSIRGSLRDRLKASELLGKSQAVFIERHRVEAVDFTALVLAAAKVAEEGDRNDG